MFCSAKRYRLNRKTRYPRFSCQERGTSLVSYSLLVVFICLACISSLQGETIITEKGLESTGIKNGIGKVMCKAGEAVTKDDIGASWNPRENKCYCINGFGGPKPC